MDKANVEEAPCLSSYSAQDVADAFVKQYYTILQVSPKDGHNFYQDQSIRAHQVADGSMTSATTLKDIDHEIMNSVVKEWNPNLQTVYAQDSVMDSVIVGVTGSLVDIENVTRNFAHTFFLAPQEGGGFYVRNDFLQFIEVNKIPETSTPVDDDGTEKESSVVETRKTVERDQNENSKSKKDDVGIVNKVADSAKGKKNEWLAAKPAKNMQEEAKKVSYASIVAKEGLVSSSASPVPPQSSPNAVAVPKPSVIPVSKQAVTPVGPPENIYDVKSIRVKDLPPKITEESLLEVLKKFGPVKQNKIQIKEYSQDGYRYAFVEFDNPKSARNAVEARFIRFEGKESEIQYKKLPNQGGPNYMRRPQGLRNENFWGHDGEGQNRTSGNWGRNNDHDNFGQRSGQNQNRDYNYNRRNQDRACNYN